MTKPTSMLHTERLILRQWREEDFVPFAELNADTRVMEFFPAPLTRDESDAFAHRCMARLEEKGWGLWALETMREGRFIGYTGLNIPAVEFPFSPCVEVGWRLARDAWGKGFATEAAQTALAFGFGELDLAEIVSFTATLNTRSRAVMHRLGMMADGTFDHPSIPEGNPLREHYLYRIQRSG